MRIGLFGGTFNPIHVGHLAAAKAALQRFQLDRVYFIPNGRPPHKHHPAPFADRLAMVALACSNERRFIPSTAEAPNGKTRYSIHTLRRFRKELGDEAELFFLIGADAFLTIRTWHEWQKVLNVTNFIVISRPGFDLARVETVLPADWKRRGTPRDRRGIEYRLHGTSVFVISGVWEPVSATDIRNALAPGGRADGSLPAAVAEYLKKTGLYAGLKWTKES